MPKTIPLRSFIKRSTRFFKRTSTITRSFSCTVSICSRALLHAVANATTFANCPDMANKRSVVPMLEPRSIGNPLYLSDVCTKRISALIWGSCATKARRCASASRLDSVSAAKCKAASFSWHICSDHGRLFDTTALTNTAVADVDSCTKSNNPLAVCS